MHRSSMVSAAAPPTESSGSWKIVVNGWAFSTTASGFLFFPGWKNDLPWPSHLSLAEVYLSLLLPFLLHYCPASLKNGLSFTVHKDTHCTRRHGIGPANFILFCLQVSIIFAAGTGSLAAVIPWLFSGLSAAWNPTSIKWKGCSPLKCSFSMPEENPKSYQSITYVLFFFCKWYIIRIVRVLLQTLQ